jgi:hypothetical protein
MRVTTAMRSASGGHGPVDVGAGGVRDAADDLLGVGGYDLDGAAVLQGIDEPSADDKLSVFDELGHDPGILSDASDSL